MMPLICAFCGKPQEEVTQLIAGPTANICDECVELCIDVIEKRFPTGELAKRMAALRAAQAIEARSDETRQGLGPKGESAVPEGNAP